MLELLVQKCILTCHTEFSQPGDLFRRVMECVASGVFLPGKETIKVSPKGGGHSRLKDVVNGMCRML